MNEHNKKLDNCWPVKASWLVWLLAMPFSAAMAQSAKNTWDLKSCIGYGLKNHRSVAVYANDKKAAAAKSKEALAAYLPSVNVTGTLDDNIKPQTTVIPAGIFSAEPIRVAFTEQYNPNAFAELDQTIYDQSLLTGLKANRYNIQQSALNEQQNSEALIYNISTDYYQVLIYKEQLKMLKANLNNYAQQREVLQLKVKKGVTLETDLNKVIVNYNNTLSQVNTAEINIDQYSNQLKVDMGLSVSDSLSIDTLPPVALVMKQEIDTGETFDVNKRTEYQVSQVKEKLLEIDQRRIRAEALPTLTAYAKYGGIGYGNDLGASFSSFGTYSVIGLKLNVPLFNFYKRNAQYSQASYKSIDARENLKIDADKYTAEYNTALTKLRKSRTNVDNDQHNLRLAEENLTLTTLQYQKGVTDLTDWLNVEYSVKEAQNNYLSSLYKSLMSQLDLEKARGTLKSFYNSL